MRKKVYSAEELKKLKMYKNGKRALPGLAKKKPEEPPKVELELELEIKPPAPSPGGITAEDSMKIVAAAQEMADAIIAATDNTVQLNALIVDALVKVAEANMDRPRLESWKIKATGWSRQGRMSEWLITPKYEKKE